MAKTITVVVHADGRIAANLTGFQGTECEHDALLKEIQSMFAPSSVKEVKKPEYYQHVTRHMRQGG